LDKNHFLALSWLISELGKLKDAGLGILVLEEASTHNGNDAATKLQTVNASAKPKLEEYMDKASQITNDFFEEKNLDKLVGEVEPLTVNV
jgi:hypothetical protein